eukprot:1952951-Amphidinium_carterae.1
MQFKTFPSNSGKQQPRWAGLTAPESSQMELPALETPRDSEGANAYRGPQNLERCYHAPSLFFFLRLDTEKGPTKCHKCDARTVQPNTLNNTRRSRQRSNARFAAPRNKGNLQASK